MLPIFLMAASIVRYDCGFLPVPALTACTATAPAAVVALVEVVEKHQSSSHFGPSQDYWNAAMRALDGATPAALATLTDTQKIVAQNAALRLTGIIDAFSAGPYVKDDARHSVKVPPGLAKRAFKLSEALALAPETLAKLGAEPGAGVEAWLGPAKDWRPRQNAEPFTMHENLHQKLVNFVPVDAGTLRALMGLIVAADTQGKLHATGIPVTLELRQDRSSAAPACIVRITHSSLGCDDRAGLGALSAPFDHLGGYVRGNADKTANCGGCHGDDQASPPFNLPPAPGTLDEARAALKLRTALFVKRAQENYQPLAKKYH